MNIQHFFKTFVLTATVSVALMLQLSSCNGVIYDDEGDCEVTYRIKFRYDMNLKWADAFANEVKSVHLYAYDPVSGNLVWEKSDKGAHLADEGYTMTLDLPAGDYKLIAWCGTENDPEPSRSESFSVNAPTAESSHHTALRCSLNRKADSDHPSYSDERLFPLFHGSIDVNLPNNEDGEDYLYVMPLTKDTNHVRVILQHLSGKDVDVNDFTFHIEDANGLMAHDNSLLPDDVIRYRTWNTMSGEAGIGKEDSRSRSIIYVNGAIADMTVGRMMADHKRDMMLTIRNKNGETVAHVPVIDYALLAKEYYEEEYGHKMTDQEFLDREDEYTLTFFLDENQRWLSTSILIHSWRVVLHNYDI